MHLVKLLIFFTLVVGYNRIIHLDPLHGALENLLCAEIISCRDVKCLFFPLNFSPLKPLIFLLQPKETTLVEGVA